MPTATVERVALDPTKTRTARNRRTDRDEVIAAASVDGRWSFEREDETTTPWTIKHHGERVRILRWAATTLDRALADAASGRTIAELDAQDARRAAASAPPNYRRPESCTCVGPICYGQEEA